MLIWLAVGAGIAAGVFLVARAIVEVSAVAYAAVERTIGRGEAARRGAALVGGAAVALVVTAVIAGIAILALLAALFQAAG